MNKKKPVTNYTEIEFIVNGQPYMYPNINPSWTLRKVKEYVLEKTGNIGQPPDQWEMIDDKDEIITHDRVSINCYSHVKRFWLSPKSAKADVSIDNVKENFILDFFVNGQFYRFSDNNSCREWATFKIIKEIVLKNTNNTTYSEDNWEVRDLSGEVIGETYNINNYKSPLWLSLKASVISNNVKDKIKPSSAMKPEYERILPVIRKVAKECGYAIGVHGSGQRDLDLIAAPWTSFVTPDTDLANAVCNAVQGRIYGYVRDNDGNHNQNPVLKAHGRKSWVIHLPNQEGNNDGTLYIDMAVMPYKEEETIHQPSEKDIEETVRQKKEALKSIEPDTNDPIGITQEERECFNPCSNCGETVVMCACIRNLCHRCGNSVGNVTFSICDDCWDYDITFERINNKKSEPSHDELIDMWKTACAIAEAEEREQSRNPKNLVKENDEVTVNSMRPDWAKGTWKTVEEKLEGIFCQPKKQEAKSAEVMGMFDLDDKRLEDLLRQHRPQDERHAVIDDDEKLERIHREQQRLQEKYEQQFVPKLTPEKIRAREKELKDMVEGKHIHKIVRTFPSNNNQTGNPFDDTFLD